ncbi:RNASEH1 (predicted) [Pycnogonum litorale]
MQVKGFSCALFKKFNSRVEAQNFIDQCDVHLRSSAQPRQFNPRRKYSSNNWSHQNTSRSRQKSGSQSSSFLSDAVHVYTDGACENNGKYGARAGIGVYWGPNHQFNTSMRLPGRQTNNRAEIQAAVIALEQARQQGFDNVVLYTDSIFLINGITKWIHKWKQNGWKLSNNEDVKNRDDFEDLEVAAHGLNVKYVHVRGHSGILGNEQADRLAVGSLSNEPEY